MLIYLKYRIALERATRDLPASTRRTLQPSVDRMMTMYGSASSGGPAHNAQPTTATTATVARTVSPPAESQEEAPREEKHQPAAAVAKPKSRIPSVATANSAQPQSSISTVAEAAQELGETGDVKHLLKKTTKAKRVEDFFRTNWPAPPEEAGEPELQALRTVWEPILDVEFAATIFAQHKFGPPNQDGVVGVLNELSAQLQVLPATIWMNHSDCLIRYLCYVLCLRETASGLLKVLSLITELMIKLAAESYILHDAEITCLLPHLIEKSGESHTAKQITLLSFGILYSLRILSGHKSERHRAAFKIALEAISDVVAANKMMHFLLQVTGIVLVEKQKINSKFALLFVTLFLFRSNTRVLTARTRNRELFVWRKCNALLKVAFLF